MDTGLHIVRRLRFTEENKETSPWQRSSRRRRRYSRRRRSGSTSSSFTRHRGRPRRRSRLSPFTIHEPATAFPAPDYFSPGSLPAAHSPFGHSPLRRVRRHGNPCAEMRDRVRWATDPVAGSTARAAQAGAAQKDSDGALEPEMGHRCNFRRERRGVREPQLPSESVLAKNEEAHLPYKPPANPEGRRIDAGLQAAAQVAEAGLRVRDGEVQGVHEPAVRQEAANDAADAASDRVTGSSSPWAEVSGEKRGNP